MKWTVAGHEAQRQHMERLITDGALSHAYLLSGPRGIGKHMFAGDMTTALLSGSHALDHNPDFILLKPGVNKDSGKPADITVETAREMKLWAYQKPLYGLRKVAIVDDADRLGAEAANTLLKVLEEPPDYLYFMLVSSVRNEILPTVASRCQELVFRPLRDADMKEVLSGTRISDDDSKLLQTVATGRPGIALALIRDGRLPEVSRSIAQLEKLLKTGVAERLTAAKSIADNDAMPEVVSWWLSWVHRELPVRTDLMPAAHGLLGLSDAVNESKFNRRLALDRFLLELA